MNMNYIQNTYLMSKITRQTERTKTKLLAKHNLPGYIGHVKAP